MDVDIPFTKADWMDTEPVELELKEGRNQILYTQKVPNKGCSIKYFQLKPMKMVVGTSALSVSSGGTGQKEITNTIGAKMVLIRPGSFLMGSTVKKKRGQYYEGRRFRGGSFRGGSWGGTAADCRSAARRDCSASSRLSGVGFRLVRTLPGQ